MMRIIWDRNTSCLRNALSSRRYCNDVTQPPWLLSRTGILTRTICTVAAAVSAATDLDSAGGTPATTAILQRFNPSTLQPFNVSTTFHLIARVIFFPSSIRLFRRSRWGHSIVSATQIFFEPNVQTGKQIAAAHFLDLELRFAGAAITPGDGQAFPSISSHNRF